MTGPWRSRAWWSYAQARRVVTRAGSSRPARIATGGSDRRNASSWTEHLAARHLAYRSAIEPASGAVAVLCVTNRPHLLDALLDGVARQSHPITELVIVTNAAAFDDVDVAAAATTRGRDLPPVTVLERAPSVSLGACLNAAIDATDARFVAKFDDDDVYGPHYLADSMRAHAYAGAAVVGKHTYYAYLAEQDRTVLRFPTHEFSYSSTLAGGTLVIDRDRIGSVRFADVSIGEDRAFIAACLRRGAATFSADRFSFTQTRSGDNTWNVDLERFLIGTTPVQSGNAADVVDL